MFWNKTPIFFLDKLSIKIISNESRNLLRRHNARPIAVSSISVAKLWLEQLFVYHECFIIWLSALFTVMRPRKVL